MAYNILGIFSPKIKMLSQQSVCFLSKSMIGFRLLFTNTGLAKASDAEPIVSNLVPPLTSVVCHHNEVCNQVN